MIDGKLCGRTPSSITLEQWITVVCEGDGITGNNVKLQRHDGNSITMCGFKVFGVLDPYLTIDRLEA